MQKFIPKEKLSKKARRKQDLAKRGSWGAMSPVTRKPDNPKKYNRKKIQKGEDFLFESFFSSHITINLYGQTVPFFLYCKHLANKPTNTFIILKGANYDEGKQTQTALK